MILMKDMNKRAKVFAGLMAAILPGIAVYMTDEYIKRSVESGKIKTAGADGQKLRTIMGGRIALRKLDNPGAAGGVLAKYPVWVKLMSGLFTLGSAGLIAGELKSKKPDLLLVGGMSAVLGGGLSNTKDRLLRGSVVDYFSFLSGPKWLKRLVFNISDAAIFLGTCISLLVYIIKDE